MTSSTVVHAESRGQSSCTIRILIVDDQHYACQMLKHMLTPDVDLQVIETANDGKSAIALVESLQPDLVLMDIEMPNMSGIEATQLITHRYFDCKVVMVGANENDIAIQNAQAAGAKGYLLKTAPASELIHAIHLVQDGYSYFGTQFQEKMLTVESRVTDESIVPRAKISTKTSSRSVQPVGVEQLALPAVQAEDFLPPIGKWITWGGISIVSVIALAIPTTNFLKYKTTVKTQATVRPVGELRLVQASTEGQISKIFAKQGQTVRKGDVIATLEQSRLQTRKNQLIKGISQQQQQIFQANAQITNIERQRIAEAERNRSEITAAEAELAGNRRTHLIQRSEVKTQVDEAQSQLRSVEATLSASKSKLTRYRYAAAEGAISKEELDEVELEVSQQQQELGASQARLKRALISMNPSSAEVEMARERIKQAVKAGQAGRAASMQEQEGLIQQRIEISRQIEQDKEELKQINKDLQHSDLKATSSGVITQLKLRNPGQTVQSGQEIAQIIPDNVALELKAGITTQEISKLKMGQKVQMRVSACAYTEYGTLDGIVSQIAKDTSKPETEEASSAPPFYEVSIKPKSDSFGRGKRVCTLKPGMEAAADIVAHEETVLKFILRKAKILNPV